MNYTEILPGREWSTMVEAYWRVERADGLLIPPDGTVNVICTGDELHLDGFDRKSFHPGIILTPPMNRAMILTSKKPVVGMRFKPFAIRRLKDWLQNEPKQITASQCKPCTSLMLAAEGESEKPIESFVPLFEEMGRVMTGGPSVQLKDRMRLNYVLIRRGLFKMSQMEKRFGMKRQSITRFFKRNFNHSTKELGSIWQMNSFLSLLETKKDTLGALLDAGYYDQAHGIKYCKKYLGATPARVLEDKDRFSYALQTCKSRLKKKYLPNSSFQPIHPKL